MNLSDPSGQSDLSEYAGQLMDAVVANAAGVGFGGQVGLALAITLLYTVLPAVVALPLVAWIGVGLIVGSVAYDVIQQTLANYSGLLYGLGSNGGGVSSGGTPPPPALGGGGSGSDLSPFIIATGQMVANEQRGPYTAGRGAVESLPYGGSVEWRSARLYGSQRNGHAEEQAIKVIEGQIENLTSEGWRGSLVVTVITAVPPCSGQYAGNNCMLNLATKWAPEVRNLAATGGITVVAVRDFYWPNRNSAEPAARWYY